MSNSNSLKTKTSPSGATNLGVPNYTLGGDKLRIRDNDYDLTPDIYKAPPHNGYTGKTLENENINFMMNKIL